MQRTPQTLSDLTGKKRMLAAFFLGALATLSLPPFFMLPMLAVSACGWFLLIDSAPTVRQAMKDGWLWGLGFFMSGLYWMCISLLVDAEKFAWLIPFCLVGLNGIIALYPMLASWVYFRLKQKWNLGLFDGSLIFVCCWSVSEYLRSILFTGFPWNLPGYVWAVWEPAMQPVSIIGIHGLTLVTMLLAISPLWIKSHIRSFAVLWSVWALTLCWGAARIPAEIDFSDTRLRIVQAAIPQSLKWDPKERMNGLRKHMILSQAESNEKPDIIIWPESAVPFYINTEPALIEDLRALAPPHGALITGGLRVEDSHYFNSIYGITREGVAAVYDKHHLVPFGEFVPFRSVLPLDKITPGDTDFSRGAGAQIMEVAGHRFTPQVCYEAIFPQHVRYDTSSPPWILNLTNDAWFGTSTGPYQHFHMTRFRAVEYGVPLVRAANTGISAVVDPYGRVVDSLPLNASGVLDVVLPREIPIAGTIMYHFRTFFFFIFLLSTAIFPLLYRKCDNSTVVRRFVTCNLS